MPRWSAARGARTRLVVIGLLAVLLVSLAPSGAAASASASWTLVNNHQSECFYPPQGWTQYYPVWISGTWSHSINVRLSGAPSGSTQWTYDTPIAPGSSDGSGSLAYIAVQVPSSTPVGTYNVTLAASDGTSIERVPATLVVKNDCTAG